MLPNAITSVDGWKTYAGLAIGAAAILFNHFVAPIPGINLDSANWLADMFGLVMLAFGRSALTKIAAAPKVVVVAPPDKLPTIITTKDNVPIVITTEKKP